MVQKQTPALPPAAPSLALCCPATGARCGWNVDRCSRACRTAASRVGCRSALQPSSTESHRAAACRPRAAQLRYRAGACSRVAAASLDAVLMSRAPVQSSAWAGTAPRPPFGSRRVGRFRGESMLAVLPGCAPSHRRAVRVQPCSSWLCRGPSGMRGVRRLSLHFLQTLRERSDTPRQDTTPQSCTAAASALPTEAGPSMRPR
jgi:hypothetical protein